MQCQRAVLANGLVVLVTENPVADIVSARIFVGAGLLQEPLEQAGVAHLLAAVLTKGTHQRSAWEIAEQVESIGASLSASAATDYFLLSLKTVSADFANLLTLGAQLLRFPSFPAPEVDLERRLSLQAIRSQQEQPFAVALEQLRQILYGHHPYAHSTLGTAATVANLERTNLEHFHQRYFRPDNLVVSLAGRIQFDSALALVEEVLGDWSTPAAALPALDLPPVIPRPQRRGTAQQTQQSIVQVGYLAPAIAAEDYIPLKLLSTYLGNGLSSRLFVELREKRGLAYEVSAFYPARRSTSFFVAYLGTAPDNTATALKSLEEEMGRLATTPLSPEELATLKNKILGQHALGKQTNAQIAQIYGWYETLGLGVDYDRQFQTAIAALSAEQVYEVAQRYFTGAPYVSLVGPAESIKAQLKR